jgi:uncharacterized protein YndB with AHSA1/START domain
MENRSRSTASSRKRELVLERLVDAPREVVFRAWTDPAQLAQWWGPHRFTNPVCEFDARPGGAVLIHMQAPDGTVNPVRGTVLEIVPPERLVFTTMGFEEDGEYGVENHNTVTFSEHGGKTRLRLECVVVKIRPDLEHALDGMPVSWNQSLDRMAALAERG